MAQATSLASIAIGFNAQAKDWFSVAIGMNSVAEDENEFSIGYNDGTNKQYRRITHVADPTAATDAATMGWVKTYIEQYLKNKGLIK